MEHVLTTLIEVTVVALTANPTRIVMEYWTNELLTSLASRY